jgi:hypothetical protein
LRCDPCPPLPTPWARLNLKSSRKARDAVREQRPDNVAVILQDRMVKSGEIVDTSIVAQPKKPKKPKGEP